MVHTTERFMPYVRGHNPLERGNKSRWACMDDRPAITSYRYRQTAGGAVGVGEDLGAALILGDHMKEMRQPEALTSIENMPSAQVLGAIATAALRPRGIMLRTHEGCAAEGAALAIRDSITGGDSDAVYEQTLRVQSGMKRARFDNIAAAFAELDIQDESDAYHILDTGTSTRWSHEGYGTLHRVESVDRIALFNSPHIAGDVLVNYRPDSAFDAERAFFEQRAAYHISMGDQVELTQGLQEAGFAFDEQDFLDASAVRHAATTLHLPSPTGQNGLNLHIIR